MGQEHNGHETSDVCYGTVRLPIRDPVVRRSDIRTLSWVSMEACVPRTWDHTLVAIKTAKGQLKRSNCLVHHPRMVHMDEFNCYNGRL